MGSDPQFPSAATASSVLPALLSAPARMSCRSGAAAGEREDTNSLHSSTWRIVYRKQATSTAFTVIARQANTFGCETGGAKKYIKFCGEAD